MSESINKSSNMPTPFNASTQLPSNINTWEELVAYVVFGTRVMYKTTTLTIAFDTQPAPLIQVDPFYSRPLEKEMLAVRLLIPMQAEWDFANTKPWEQVTTFPEAPATLPTILTTN